MGWLDSALDQLTAQPICGYGASAAPASEPTALAALALWGHGRGEPALRASQWLAQVQASDGSVGIRPGETTPEWPTSLAALAWLASANAELEERAKQAGRWILSLHGEASSQAAYLGHDTSLVAWPWVRGTHSWVEPTALHLLALKALDHYHHPRSGEAVKLLLNRQLASGGCNYGNTTVLDQQLRAHVQPSGMALLALAGEFDPLGRITRSTQFLRHALSTSTTPVSLGWGLLGLAAHGILLPNRHDLLMRAARWVSLRGKHSHKLALLALAALERCAPLITLPAIVSQARDDADQPNKTGRIKL